MYRGESGGHPLRFGICVSRCSHPVSTAFPVSEPPPSAPRVLLVDDDDLFADATAVSLRARGYAVATAYSLADAAAHEPRRFDYVVADHQLPDGSGLTIASHVDGARTRLVLISANPRVEAAIEALRLGFIDFLPKPIDLAHLLSVIDVSRGASNPGAAARAPEPEPITVATHFYDGSLDVVARARCPVLITGETGCGKGHLARTLHALGDASRPFVAVNCAAIPETLIEAELFGVERGAFTGAESRQGLVERAELGTLFLDEIGELPLSLQTKLLTFLDDGEFRRVGGSAQRSSRVRVLAATNRDIDDAVTRGAFRADLLHRLDVARIELPPLRERDDFDAIATAILAQLSTRDRRSYRLGPGEIPRLRAHRWPGNVRELSNTIERSALHQHQGGATSDELWPSRFVRAASVARATVLSASTQVLPPPPPSDVRTKRHAGRAEDLSLERAERQHVQHVLELCGGNRTVAAAALGIGVSTLRRKLSDWSAS